MWEYNAEAGDDRNVCIKRVWMKLCTYLKIYSRRSIYIIIMNIIYMHYEINLSVSTNNVCFCCQVICRTLCASLLAHYNTYIRGERGKWEWERENPGKSGRKLDLPALVRKTRWVVCQNLYKSIDPGAVLTVRTFSAVFKIPFMKCFLLPSSSHPLFNLGTYL